MLSSEFRSRSSDFLQPLLIFAQQAKPVQGKIHVALVAYEPGLVQLYMCERQGFGTNKLLFPVPYLLHLEIVNPRSEEVTITKYKIELSKQEDGPWTLLVPIDMNWPGSQLFQLTDGGAPGRHVGALAFKTGGYKLSPPNFGLDYAAPLFFSSFLSSRLSFPLEAHETIYEWQPFALQDRSFTSFMPAFYRMTLYGAAGDEFQAVLPFPHGSSQTTDTHPAELTLLESVRSVAPDHLDYYDGSP